MFSADLTVNGLQVKAAYTEDDLQRILDLRKKIDDVRTCAGRRVIIFLAAPPAAGKSTLVIFMEQLTGFRWSLKSVGLDGFHYPNRYLSCHTLPSDHSVLLNSVKGSPETFDTDLLLRKLQELRSGKDVRFPIYDRTIHDPVPDAVTVREDIVLLEGNWLLLSEDPWERIRSFTDLTVRLEPTDPGVLRERLISRKAAGGLSRADAEAWYEKSDRHNVDRFYRESVPGDYVLRLSC